MSVAAILAPVFVLVALTFALMFWTGVVRYGSVARRQTRISDIALGQGNWPPHITQVGNSFNNQFQLPMLFYVLVILAYVLRKADLLFVIMSWVFVVLRILHAWIHTTSNNMTQRFAVYTAGAFVLLVMWVIFALRILLGL
jgi:hypothetical protein